MTSDKQKKAKACLGFFCGLLRPESRRGSGLLGRAVVALGLGVLGGPGVMHRGFLGAAGLGVLGGSQRAAVGGWGQESGSQAEGDQSAFHMLSPGY